MNYRDFLQKVIYVIINPIIKMMIKLHITPNIVTFVGFIGNIVAAAFFIDAAWKLGEKLTGTKRDASLKLLVSLSQRIGFGILQQNESDLLVIVQ